LIGAGAAEILLKGTSIGWKPTGLDWKEAGHASG
jgi:hypothetical protein